MILFSTYLSYFLVLNASRSSLRSLLFNMEFATMFSQNGKQLSALIAILNLNLNMNEKLVVKKHGK